MMCLRVSPDGSGSRIVFACNRHSAGEYKISTVNAAQYHYRSCNDVERMFLRLLHSLDFYINYATSGEVTLYCDGTSYADYTGNVTTNSATQLNQVALGADGSS